jgi:atypical dual specificity phosphatase
MGMALQRFYWMIPDMLAGCSRPGGRDGAEDVLDADLAWLRCQGIGAVLSVTETPLAARALARHGLASLHLPVADLTAPAPLQLARALSFLDWQRAHDVPTVVHCLMGQGRTATVLAAHLIRGGLSADEALRELRALCPGAVSSADQERALAAFAARRDWVL